MPILMDILIFLRILYISRFLLRLDYFHTHEHTTKENKQDMPSLRIFVTKYVRQKYYFKERQSTTYVVRKRNKRNNPWVVLEVNRFVSSYLGLT